LHRPSHRMKLEDRPLVMQFINHVNMAISIHGLDPWSWSQ
jgi:hypothetical protein